MIRRRRHRRLALFALLLAAAVGLFLVTIPPRRHPQQNILVRDEATENTRIRIPVPHDDESSHPSEQRRRQQRRRLAEEVMSVTVSFQDIYRTIIFIAVAWILGTLCSKIGLPSLVGEIATGFLLGPPLADFVPFPEAMVLMGNIGLIGLMLESGINIDVPQLKESGLRAVIMAFVGSALPLVVGLGLGLLAQQDIQSSISIGASFAPSSFGVAAGALSSGGILNTPIGQMIVASSVVDDVLGLVLLAIVEVFTAPNPRAIDFVIPFISSFGYLIVLGYSGVTWIPRVIEKKVMPLFPLRHREFAAFALMFFLLIAYMPLLHYSKASSLTGAFLAGLTFSQINSIHASFVNKGRHLLNWLLRIFFSATIGFQVPITSFNDPYVLKWGGKFLLAILVKMPLGVFVPHYQREIPDDFPYNPYWRDVWITALSVTCRGEFNFIIASFALGAGLIDANLYAGIVFAVLIAAIVGPLLLSRVIQHYNNLSKTYLTTEHPIHRIGNTSDGYRPLFLSIQARTPVHWGLQDTFKKALEQDGLVIIDHRSWHTTATLESDSVDITELFVQDTKVRVRIARCFADVDTFRTLPTNNLTAGHRDDHVAATTATTSEQTMDEVKADSTKTDTDVSQSSTGVIGELEEIEARCNEIREVLVQCLLSDDPSTYTIKVSQWKPFSETNGTTHTVARAGRATDARSYCLLHSEHDDNDSDGGGDVEEGSISSKNRESLDGSFVDSNSLGVPSQVAIHRRQVTDPFLDCPDLWDEDKPAQEACHQEFFTPGPSGHVHVTGGHDETHHATPGHRRRASTISSRGHRSRASTSSNPFAQENADDAENIKERLHGYVRD